MKTDFIDPYGLGIQGDRIYSLRGDTLQTFLWAMNLIHHPLIGDNSVDLERVKAAVKSRIEAIINGRYI